MNYSNFVDRISRSTERRELKLTLSILLLGLIWIFPALLSAQGFGLPESERRGKLRAVVYQLDSLGEMRGTGGWIIERNDSSILFDNGRELMSIPRSTISHIDLLIRPRDDIPAAVFAGSAYLACHLLVLHENSLHPDQYMREGSTYTREPLVSMLSVGLVGGLSGGIIASFVSSGFNEERKQIEVDEGRSQEGWERLGSEMKSASHPMSLQVTTSGLIAFGSDDVIAERYENAGFAFERVGSIDGVPHVWFRRLRLGYSISPTLDVGFTMANLSLPQQNVRFIIPHFPADLIRTNVEMTVRGYGYAPSILFRPSGQNGGVELGFGAGISPMGFYERIGNPDPITREMKIDSVEETTLSPFAMINADFSLYLTEGLWLSLTADLMLAPSLTPPARSVGREAEPESIPLTSASAGVSLGYRF